MVLVALVAIMGIVSYLTIPKESFPNITVPNIFVVTLFWSISGGYGEFGYPKTRG